MRSTRRAIGAGILFMTLGLLGAAGGRGAPAALAQAGMPPTGMSGGGMMGNSPAPQQGTAPSGDQVSEAQARQSATQFLAGYLPGARVGDGDAFYGYYHFDVMQGGRQVGMLSVSAQNGQVWYHTWHGE